MGVGGTSFGASVPSTLHFQGRVLVEGIPFTGTGEFRFALVDAAEGVVWGNAPDVGPSDGVPDSAVSLAVQRGLYGVRLGEGMAALPAGVFAAHEALGLRVWFDDGTHGVQRLEPDQPLGSVAYAWRSASAETADWAAAAATAQVAAAVAGNATFTGLNVFSGRVGVGTNAPGSELEVAGTVRAGRVVTRATSVVSWGAHPYGQDPVPFGLTEVAQVAAGEAHSLALRLDGTVVAWGDNFDGQTSVPAELNQALAVAAGRRHSVAVRSDGAVLAWGWNQYGQAAVPAGLSQVTAIASGDSHNLALKADGSVVAWGANSDGQNNIPAGLGPVVAVACGGWHSLALRADGTVAAWGWNVRGQANVPVGLSDVVAIAGGWTHSLALKSDGTVVAWGSNLQGQSTIPPGLNRVVSIAARVNHSLALRADGTVVAWGSNDAGQLNVPAGLDHVVGLTAGYFQALAIRSVPFGDPASQSLRPSFTAGLAAATSDTLPAVHGMNAAADGWAGYFEGRGFFSDRVGIGTNQPTSALEVRGDVKVTPTAGGGGVTVVANGIPAGYVLRDGGTERGVLGVAAAAGQLSAEAAAGDVVLRTATTATRLLVQNGAGAGGLVVRDNRLGVGVTNPDAPLSIRRDSANAEFGYCLGLNDRNGTPWWKIGADNNGGFSIGAAGLRDRDIAINRLNGDVRVSSSLYVNGTAHAAGFQQTSDGRWKSGVADLGDALARIEALRGVSFEWRTAETNGVRETGRQLGFVAQEVARVLPELVRTNADGYLTMSYAGVTPVLVEALKELKWSSDARMAEKDAEIEALRVRLSRLETMLDNRR
jgi:hypothetical protein